jgi:hypothetical protein
MARTKQKQTARKSTTNYYNIIQTGKLRQKLETKTGRGTGKGRKSTVGLFFTYTLIED